MDQDPSQIREEIEGTRADLADTIEALGQKADIKGRVAEKVKEGSERLTEKAHDTADQVQQAVPDQLAPAVSAVTGTLQEAGRRAAAPKHRTTLIVGGTLCVIVLVVLFRRWRQH